MKVGFFTESDTDTGILAILVRRLLSSIKFERADIRYPHGGWTVVLREMRTAMEFFASEECAFGIIAVDSDSCVPHRAHPEDEVAPGSCRTCKLLAEIDRHKAPDQFVIPAVPVQAVEAWLMAGKEPAPEAVARALLKRKLYGTPNPSSKLATRSAYPVARTLDLTGLRQACPSFDDFSRSASWP